MKLKRIGAQSISLAFLRISKTLNFWKGFRILLYHAVGSTLPHDSYGISIAPQLFERHMKALAELTEASVVPFHGSSKGNSMLRIAVTLDDGYLDNLSTAAPILLRYGIPFTVFVTTSFVQGASSLYMNTMELKELSSLEGVSIGSHGVTHTRLTQCDDATLREELHGSKCYLEDILGKPVTAISYPHGLVNRRVRDAASKAGYDTGGCSRFGINVDGCDRLLLCRTEIVATDSIKTLREKIYGAWDWYAWFQMNPFLP